ncbi:Hypothetical Protein FCC1311_006522 [Hondaea fermentalgiana]|uniref:Uncharacterized protein n=1 Tax=Hondaea fermentalgiana TaxID=2315210 RepID=A0A2R5G9U3_9STRA|nr:Hypothetical Protein FCC1311_006522 [Hondaea fermentalgiana]|eukprot:GBG24434.1 Hypothetical Protein FCC1311_006522 [Hondaea fermentalgiana]
MQRVLSGVEEMPVFDREGSAESLGSAPSRGARSGEGDAGDAEGNDFVKTAREDGLRLRNDVRDANALLPPRKYRFVGLFEDVTIREITRAPDGQRQENYQPPCVSGCVFLMHNAIIIAGAREDIDESEDGWVPGLVDTEHMQHRFHAGVESAAYPDEELGEDGEFFVKHLGQETTQAIDNTDRGVVASMRLSRLRRSARPKILAGQDDQKSSLEEAGIQQQQQQQHEDADDDDVDESEDDDGHVHDVDDEASMQLLYMLKLDRIKLVSSPASSSTVRFRYALRTSVQNKSTGRVRFSTHIFSIELGFVTPRHCAEFRRQIVLSKVKANVEADFDQQKKSAASSGAANKVRRWNREKMHRPSRPQPHFSGIAMPPRSNIKVVSFADQPLTVLDIPRTLAEGG